MDNKPTLLNLISGAVIAIVIIGIGFYFAVNLFGLELNYSMPKPAVVGVDKNKVTAKIIEDLATSTSPTVPSSFYVLQFFKGDTQISSNIAVPVSHIGLTSKGKLAVGIFDGYYPDSEDAIYLAEVIEDPVAMSVSSNPNRPPFTGLLMYAGYPCFSQNYEHVEECTGDNIYILGWGLSDGDIYPPWQEAEALGPMFAIDAFRIPDIYVRLHTLIDRSNPPAPSSKEPAFGPQPVE